MKSLTHYIQEKLIIKKSTPKKNKIIDYKYFPKTKEELKEIIKQRIKTEGNKLDLNDIDVSNITDMSNLFEDLDFNGDISMWDVSNVTDMNYMFAGCNKFNQDISNWDVSNVTYMYGMFSGCTSFNRNIYNWDVSNVKNMGGIFNNCAIEEKYKPKLK